MDLARATVISEGVVAVVSVNTLEVPSGPMAGVHRAISTSIISTTDEGDGRPQILSTHNTLIAAGR